MADQEENDTTQALDIVAGHEPGSSRTSVLIPSESYANVDAYFDASDGQYGHKRLPSGSIDEIKAEQNCVEHDSEIAGASGNSPSSLEDSSTVEVEDKLDVNSSNVVENHTAENSIKENHVEENTIEENSTADNSKEVKGEDITSMFGEDWKSKKKHVFIFSNAGKPIYSRYGDENSMAELLGPLLMVEESYKLIFGDNLRSFRSSNSHVVYLVKPHITLVTVTKTYESKQQLLLQLTYLYNQLLSIITLKTLDNMIKQSRSTFDIRRMLTGAEKFFDNLSGMMETDPSFILGAVRCLPMENSVRDSIAQIIAQNAKAENLVFAILVAENQLVTLVRLKAYFLHPLDLHLIFNLVSASESFKTAESWTPICLPKFDSNGYLHAHISYLDEACRACLLLLNVDRNMFFPMSDCKHKIQQKLMKQNLMKGLSNALHKTTYGVAQCSIPDLRHFLYKSKSTAQFTSPHFDPPYNTQDDRDRVFSMYQYLHHRIHSAVRPLKVLFHVGQYETLLGWSTSGFELYAVFGPLVTKPIAINSINKLLKWIKKEEERLFILNSPTF